jgi:hypothetical protein
VFHTAGGILIPDTRRRTMSQFERGLDGQRRERTQEGRDCTDVA